MLRVRYGFTVGVGAPYLCFVLVHLTKQKKKILTLVRKMGSVKYQVVLKPVVKEYRFLLKLAQHVEKA